MAAALFAWAPTAAKALVPFESSRPFLLGTIEFRGAPLGGWYRFSDKVAESLEMLTRCARSMETCPRREVAALLADTAKLRGASPLVLLRAVNRLANRHPYRSDLVNFKTREHWASPIEFLARSGDCEDYAIFKYALLRHLGMPADALRVVLLRHKADGRGHAVLAVYLEDTVYILDNIDGLIRPQDEVTNYVPVFSFNETARWAHIEGLPEARPARTSRVAARQTPGGWGHDEEATLARLHAAVFAPARRRPQEYRIQLGAFRTLKSANELWQRVWRDQWDLLAEAEPRIHSQSLGDGAQLHLLQIGASETEHRARALCARLSARGVDCFVVPPTTFGPAARVASRAARDRT